MATSRADYLKKYLSEHDSGEIKKKKRKKRPIGSQKPTGFKIVDEDIDINATTSAILDEEEECPTVAEIIDERPEEIKLLEKYQSEKWKKLGHLTDEDDSSPSKKKVYLEDDSPPRRKRHDSEDYSPPRRKRHDSSDISPPRAKIYDSDQSPARKQKNSDPDQSPPSRRNQSDSDQSPPRRTNGSDSDQSPPRRQNGNDSDQSPPRKRKIDSSDIMKKTLSGKLAGLSSATDMKREADKLMRKEKEAFSKIGDDLLGKNSATVFRDKSTGKRRDMKGEKDEEAAQNKEIQDKYKLWNKGIKQDESDMARVDDMVHEMSKPLARTADDADRDSYLKDQDREGDPMLAFIVKKKSSAKSNQPKYPKYIGPAPPNRFNVRPGYRWDGVDRSTGFEKDYFLSLSNKTAMASEIYKWSTEDM